MAKRTFAVFLVAVVASLVFGQEFTWTPLAVRKEATKLRPGEIPVEKAMEAASDFLKKAGLTPSTSKPRVSRIEHKTWSEWSIIYGGDYMFYVNATTGRIDSFWNLASDQAERRTGRSGKVAFRNELDLHLYARSYLKRLGLAESLAISNTQYYAGNDPALGNVQENGVVSVTLSAKPHGYLHFGDSNSVVLSFDIQDGTLIRYRNTLEMYSIESWTRKLDFEAAKLIADRVAKVYGLGKPRSDQLNYVPAGKSELLYVVPDGWFGAPESDYRLPYKCRLAWVIRYPFGHAVWVDAGDGRILGGGGPGKKGDKPNNGG